MIRVGDKITGMLPTVSERWHGMPAYYPCTVVYVHPAGRYFVVAWDLPGGSYNEVFYSYPRSAATGAGKTKKEGDNDNHRNHQPKRRRG